MKRHWSRTYRMVKHMVDLYQAPIKGIKINFIDLEYHNDLEDLVGYFNTLNRRSICYLDLKDPIIYFYTPNGVDIFVLYLFEDTNGYHIETNNEGSYEQWFRARSSY